MLHARVHMGNKVYLEQTVSHSHTKMFLLVSKDWLEQALQLNHFTADPRMHYTRILTCKYSTSNESSLPPPARLRVTVAAIVAAIVHTTAKTHEQNFDYAMINHHDNCILY